MGIFSESSIYSFGQDGHIKFSSLLGVRLSVDLSELQIFQETKSDPDAPSQLAIIPVWQLFRQKQSKQ